MRRFWVSACVLALVFGAALVNGRQLARVTGQVADLLEQAQCQADAAQPEKARLLTEQARLLWQSRSGYLCLVLRRSDIDEISGRLSALGRLPDREAWEEYAQANEELVQLLDALARSEQLKLRNLL